jgi:hypothetical protein
MPTPALSLTRTLPCHDENEMEGKEVKLLSF